MNDKLVRDFDYNASNNIGFCEVENSIGHPLIAVKDTQLTYLSLSTPMSVGKLVKH